MQKSAIRKIVKNKTQGFTIISNESCKATTLMAMMIALPPTWDLTLKGLATLKKDCIDSVRTGIKELEKAGYISRNTVRNERGQISKMEYTVYESLDLNPHHNDINPKEPELDFPITGKTENLPELDFPHVVNPTQLKTKYINNYNNNISINQDTYRREEMDSIDKIDKQEIAEKIKKQVNYPKLTEEHEQDKSMIDSIVGILSDTEASCAETMRIAKEDKPLAEIKARFAQLTNEHIAYVLECISAQSRKPRNIKSYLLTALYNAPATMGAYFTAKARERPTDITDIDLLDYKSLVNCFPETG
jgi:DNA-binding Lrp family transcriptional regulator